MGKCYTISFDSHYFYGGGGNNRRTYLVNWDSILPKHKRFKVKFSYMSDADVLNIGTVSTMSLLLNLGQSNNFWSNNTNGIQSSQYIGSLRIAVTADGTRGYYYADTESNPPIYLNERPSQTTLEVQLHDGLSGSNYTNPVPVDYVLTVSFEEEDD